MAYAWLPTPYETPKPLSQGSTPKSALLTTSLTSTELSKTPLRTTHSSLLHTRKFTSVDDSGRLDKGMKLLYQLFPRPVPKIVLSQESSLTRNLIRPMKKSLLLHRVSVKVDEKDGVLAQIRRIFQAQQKEALFPQEVVSDVERLDAESKARIRRLKPRQTVTQPNSPLRPSSPVEVPGTRTESGHVQVREVRRRTQPLGLPPRPTNRTKLTLPRSLIVDLPQLPFSQHSSYNHETDFVRRHFLALREDTVIESSQLTKSKRLDTKLKVKNRLKNCRSN